MNQLHDDPPPRRGRRAPYCLAMLLGCALLASTGFGQEWEELPLPDGIEHIKVAGNSSEPGALALWGTRAPVADSSGSVTQRQWVFYLTGDAGDHWTAVDSSRFTTIVSQGRTLYTTWFEIVFAGTMLARTTMEVESPDLITYQLERKDSTGAFRPIGFPGALGPDTASPRVFAAGNGVLYNVRYAQPQRIDSTWWSLFAASGTPGGWRIVPDSASGMHRTARPLCLAFRPDIRNSFLLGTAAGLASSANGGKSWAPIVTGSALDVSSVSIAAMHPRRESLQFAVARQLAGDGLTHLYRSIDFGVTWEDVFADTVITGMSLSASDVSRLALVTQRGVLASSDTGNTWRSIHGNLPGPYGIAAPQFLHLDPGNAGRMYTATAQSLHRLATWPTDAAQNAPPWRATEVEVYPNPVVRGSVPFLSLSCTAAETAQLNLLDLLGRAIAPSRQLFLLPGRNIIPVSGPGVQNLRPGVYFLSLRSSSQHLVVPITIAR